MSRSPALRDTAFLTERPFAHRGLHGDGLIENSLSAFAAAIEAGVGMECDVQASRDGEAFVFHDALLDRLSDARGPVAERTSEALDGIRLKGCGEPIPRLAALLALVDGRLPLLVEIKAQGARVERLCRAVAHQLSQQKSADKVAVMSFNPQVGRWFERHAPTVVRGLVVSEENKRGLRGRIERALALGRARPDFLAYDIRDLPTSSFAAAARRRGLPVLTWTVRTAGQRADAARFADQPIFETGHD